MRRLFACGKDPWAWDVNLHSVTFVCPYALTQPASLKVFGIGQDALNQFAEALEESLLHEFASS